MTEAQLKAYIAATKRAANTPVTGRSFAVRYGN